MPAAHVGSVRKHKNKRVVVLKTDLRTDGANAVMVAQLTATRPRRTTPCVATKTLWGDYYVLLDQVKVVKADEVITAWTGPERLKRSDVDAIRQELDKRGG